MTSDDIEREATFVQASARKLLRMLETECPDALASALAPENKMKGRVGWQLDP